MINVCLGFADPSLAVGDQIQDMKGRVRLVGLFDFAEPSLGWGAFVNNINKHKMHLLNCFSFIVLIIKYVSLCVYEVYNCENDATYNNE